MEPGRAYAPRLVDRTLREYVAAFPAVLITGPRATGKTTTGSRVTVEVVR